MVGYLVRAVNYYHENMTSGVYALLRTSIFSENYTITTFPFFQSLLKPQKFDQCKLELWLVLLLIIKIPTIWFCVSHAKRYVFFVKTQSYLILRYVKYVQSKQAKKQLIAVSILGIVSYEFPHRTLWHDFRKWSRFFYQLCARK